MSMADLEEAPSPDLSDYLAAIKRRRMLLASIALPIIAISAALAVGLPNIYIATGLFSFTDATVPGEMPANTNANDIQRLQEQYRDAYVDSLTSGVLSDASIKQLIAAVPAVVPAGTSPDDGRCSIPIPGAMSTSSRPSRCPTRAAAPRSPPRPPAGSPTPI
jgi:hypothetical protein